MSDDNELLLREQPVFEARWHRFERICWLVMALIAATALAGFLGQGPASSRRLAFPGTAATLEYDRFAHVGVPARLVFTLDPRNGGTPVMHVDRSLLSAMDLAAIVPRPMIQRQDGAGLTYVFAPGAPVGEIQFRVQPRQIGPVAGMIALNGAALRVDAFVFS